MNEPTKITAGDSATWTRDEPSYPATSGWVVTYVFRCADRAALTITCTGSGATHTATLSTTDSALLSAGSVPWQCFATKTGQRVTLDTGRIEVAQNFAGSDTFDPRSRVKRTLDAIESCIEGTAGRDERTLTVDGLALELRPIADLLLLRDRYATLYRQELDAERVAKGLGRRSRILVRFQK